MKRTGYILLLLICLLQSGGLMLIYTLRQSYIHLEMQQKLKSSESRFEKLSLTLDEFKRCRIQEDEIFIDGKIYDIRTCKITGDKVELLALNDTEETDILEKIKDLITNNNTNPGSEVPSPLTELMALDYIFPDGINDISILEKQEQNFFEYSNSFSAFHPDVLIPPPRLA